MHMKNTKALFLIILGSFLLPTGFAFAENVSLGQAESAWKNCQRATSVSPSLTMNKGAAAPAYTVASTTPAPSKPIGATIKKYLTDNSRNIALGAIGAFAGFALFGPVGIVLGALFFVGLGMV